MSTPFLTELPARPEAILKVVAQAYNAGSLPLQTACSSLEAPSAVLAAHELAPKLGISFGETPDPDPRVPFEPVKVRLWQYEGHDATPALPAAAEALVAAVGAGIAREFELDDWIQHARETARAFNRSTPCELLAAMLVTAPCPGDQWPWDWLFRTQVYTALLVANADTSAFSDSDNVAHLVDVVHGPVDWTTTAALVGLVSRARHDPRCVRNVTQLLLGLLERPMTPIWYMCAYKPALQLLQLVPNVPSDLAPAVSARLQELADDDHDDDER